MYLEHFNIEKYPFSITPNTAFYCELPAHEEAYTLLKLSLAQDEGFIKIIGEVGTGKTLLCRLLLNTLDDSYVVAYVPNPDLGADGLRLSIAEELGIENVNELSPHEVLPLINERLLHYYKIGKKVVLLLDEAQALSFECLEAVRLLTNLETEEAKLLQVVLFGQPELDKKLNQEKLRQLKQRITFAYNLKPLQKEDMEAYLCHRLNKAGYTYGSMFTRKAKKLLHRASRGLPRLLNILCHKSMLVAYGKGHKKITPKAIRIAVKDTESATLPSSKIVIFLFWLGLSVIAVTLVLYIYRQAGII